MDKQEARSITSSVNHQHPIPLSAKAEVSSLDLNIDLRSQENSPVVFTNVPETYDKLAAK